VTLLGIVTDLLRARGTSFALIGAAAMAIHGVSRATTDIDLLVVDPRVLDREHWTGSPAVDVSIRPGGIDDPLAGVVRVRQGSAAPLDVVVGNARWQADIVAAATPTGVLGLTLPVARRADLILLKLYAGGPQDIADIIQLLHGADVATAAPEVDRGVADLPEDSRHLWARLRPTG
jgi:predicted nucleotidyltransferase